MSDIVDGMAQKISINNITALKEVSNLLSIPDIDVEHLITLYEASGTKKHNKVAKDLKKLFREEIEEKIDQLGDDFFPKLLASLLDMHTIVQFQEELIAIITLNYEDLLEQAMQHINGGINYSIRTVNKNKDYSISNNNIPIVKLHGSFNWKSEFPISVQKRIKKEEDVLWIPPGVVKKRENYPFNMLWSIARELLDCDILRIVGCSLSRNDWELIALLFTTQRLRTDKKEYSIELIDYPTKCDVIKSDYRYLTMNSILDILEMRSYFINEHFPQHRNKEVIPAEVFDELRASITPDRENIFLLWLRAKGEYLEAKGVDISTNNNYFRTFIRSGLGQ